MNGLQKQALDIALGGHNLLVLGTAGTGKSFLIQNIAKELSLKGIKVQITCSTGIACNVYNGIACTVHQFTGISDGRHGPDNIVNVIKNNRKYEYVINNIRQIDTLIIDECSMVSKQVFNAIRNVCKIKDPQAVFGGIQVILCGDFFQLPPVPNTTYGDYGEFCFQLVDFNTVFPHKVVLMENVRQGESELIKTITEVFAGRLSQETEKNISDLKRPLPIDKSNARSLKLFSRNDLANDYNRKCLLEQSGDMYEFKSSDQGKQADLAGVPAPHTLWLKVGCPVILLRNLTNKLVNGLHGYVKIISDEGQTPIVEFPSVNITIKMTKMKFTVFSPRLNADIAIREQYPLALAYGLTIHKAQGMTLSRVEIDCRGIFKAGQLGVGLSRTTDAAGLRVINFHPRYIIPPPQSVRDFMNETSMETKVDLTCCRLTHRLPCNSDQDILHQSTSVVVEDGPQDNFDIEDTRYENIDGDLDDEFNTVISAIISNETEAVDFEIPEQFNLDAIMQSMLYKKEVTKSHATINTLVHGIEFSKLILFVKKIFLKLAIFVKNLNNKKDISCGIPEKQLVNFYRSVHEFSISTEYRMNCLMLFEVQNYSDNHMIICYNILEAVRLFFLKQKVDLLKIRGSNLTTRNVTNASRARIRYVAGYCLASLRKKYTKMQNCHMYSKSKESQDLYIDAKWVVYILNLMQEDENYLKIHTNEPESLLDVERKQYSSRGLINVTDSVFNFFVNLTEQSLPLMVHENLMQYGKGIYNRCVEIIVQYKPLYKEFADIVATSHTNQSIEEFNENDSVESVLYKIVFISSQTCKIFHEIVNKYLMVLLSQFRKDIKSAFRIEKTMAHRKQIKVSKKTEQSDVHTKSDVSKVQLQRGPSEELHFEIPQPGPSYQTENTINNYDICQSCLVHNDDDMIQCCYCKSSFHRKCCGLRSARLWNKFSAENVQWLCRSCK